MTHSQTVTIEIPDPIFQQLTQIAAVKQQSIEQLITHNLVDYLPLILALSPEVRQFLDRKVLQGAVDGIDLSDGELRQAVFIGMEALEAGQYTDYDEAELQGFFDDIRRKG